MNKNNFKIKKEDRKGKRMRKRDRDTRDGENERREVTVVLPRFIDR